MRCEACRTSAASVFVDDDDPEQPYRLCDACSERLRNKALRPLEWFNLAAIHGWRKYLLHDDFYDQDGTAHQSEAGTLSVVGPPSPSLKTVSGSLERLVDYCITRWRDDAEAYAAVAAFPREAILVELDRRIEVPNRHIFGTCLAICANALDSQAAPWVCDRYERAIDEGLLFAWAEAAARCLPQPEGLQRTMDALAALDDRAQRDRKMALLWFRSPAVLDWIEARVPNAGITEDWGRLAALSTLDWPRVQSWLKRGRPLSLVAIDALRELIPRPGQALVLYQLKPKLEGCDDPGKISAALEDYLAVDDVPRVAQRCRFIIDRLDELQLA